MPLAKLTPTVPWVHPVSILDQIDLIACSLPHIDVPVIITKENSLKEIS
jgi:hypothetical protein